MSKRILYLGLDPKNYEKECLTHYPIIKIVPRLYTDPAIQQVLCNFDHYTDILITSQSTARILSDYLPLFDIPLISWRKKITYTVGKATANYLESLGISPAAIAQNETSEGLVEVLSQVLDHRPRSENYHIFWPHSSRSRPILKDFLCKCQIPYTACDLYDTQVNIPGPLPFLDSFDEIVFTSPSTVDAFLEIFGHRQIDAKLIPVGPITADYLNKKLSF